MGYAIAGGVGGSPFYHGDFEPEVNPEASLYGGRGRPTGTPGKDGLIKRTITDESNRPMTEYGLPPNATKASTWMAPYMAAPKLQMRISTNSDTNEAFSDSWHRSHRADGSLILHRNKQGQIITQEI